ncbi:hypothetical protein [Comamonas sp.]|uniref:hypothetical protein n=1 Tax=Comamonas sp. TaxID=34028 RepID=UPI003D0AB615
MEIAKPFDRRGIRYNPGDPLPEGLDKTTLDFYKRHGMVREPMDKQAKPTERKPAIPRQTRQPSPTQNKPTGPTNEQVQTVPVVTKDANETGQSALLPTGGEQGTTGVPSDPEKTGDDGAQTGPSTAPDQGAK